MSDAVKTAALPVIRREATIEKGEEANTFRAVYSTGAAVRRWDWEDGLYSEELSLASGHIRTARLDAGIVPILKDHRQSVDSQVGVVTKAWIEGGKAHAEFRMESGTPEADALLNKLNQGIIRSLSVGYRVHKFLETRNASDKIPVRRAVDWEPMEISLVAIPADAGAVIRSEGDTAACVIEIAGVPAETPASESNERSSRMPDIETNPAADTATRAAEMEAVRRAAADEARAAERTRASGIQEAVRKAKLGADFAEKLVAEGASLDKARELILEELASKDAQTETRSQVQVGHSYDAPDAVRAALVNAFAHKMAPKAVKLEGKGTEFRSFSMLEGFAAMEEANGRRVRFNREELAKRALMGTSDFPVILADAAHRVVLADYEAATPAYKAIAQQRNFEDFRPHLVMRTGEFPALQDLSEHGEIKSAAISDASTEQVSLKTRAIKLGVTRQLLVNDQLGLVADVMGKSGRRIAAQENQIAWAVLKANPKMADGAALFSAARKNLHGSVVATPDLDALSAARTVLKQHRSEGIPLNFRAKWFVVPTELELTAEKLMTAVLATATGDVNVWSGKLSILSDAELDDHGAWYVATSPDEAPVLTYGYLGGASGPSVETKPGWDVDGAEMRIIHDFGVGAIGDKGIYKFKRS